MSAGVAKILKDEKNRQSLKDKGKKISEESLQEAKNQLQRLKSALQDFAAGHKDVIQKDPVFRRKLDEMCAELGVDPLQSSKGAFSSLLGVGDFYHELSIKIVDVCLKQNHANGGLISYKDVIEAVKRTYRDPPKIESKDISIALRNLKVLGSGYTGVKIGKHRFIKTVPFDIDGDLQIILGNAQRGGVFDDSANPGWPQERFQKAIDTLMDQGFVWVDTYQGKNTYYVCASYPGFA